MTTVCTIDVARHFADYLELVVERGERFTLTREGKPVAELGPVLSVVRIEDLPAVVASLARLTPAQAHALRHPPSDDAPSPALAEAPGPPP